MSKELLEKVRRMVRILQNTDAIDLEMIKQVGEELKYITGANILLVQKAGLVLLHSLQEGEKEVFPLMQTNEGTFLQSNVSDKFRNIFEIRENITLGSLVENEKITAEMKKYKLLILPVKSSGVRAGTLVLYKPENVFSEEEMLLAEFLCAMSGLVLNYGQVTMEANRSRELTVVKAAISTLSYSELDAVIHIFDELNDKEGLLVASKIADKAGITRSVIVNALRKLESAGVIESRSLGMKGTYLRVSNEYFLSEMSKLR